MRFLFALLIIRASAIAQDPGIVDLAARLGKQLQSRQIRSVAVLRFTNLQNYDSQLSAYLVDRLNRGLVTQGGGLEVASRSQSDALLRELRLPDNRELTTKDLQTVAMRLSVAAIITGTFAVAAQSITVDTTILDGTTTHIIGGETVKLERGDLEAYLVERHGVPDQGPVLSIPSGTAIEVKLNEKVDAAAVRNGRTVSGSLAANVVVGNVTVARKGAEVKLQARSPDGMELHITLASVTLADQRLVAATSDEVIKAATKNALGGVLGGITRGGSTAPQVKPGEVAKDAVISLHLNQEVR